MEGTWEMDGKSSGGAWPVIAGSFTVGDPGAPVAVCALTSERLVDPLARVPGVAIAGKVYTANLGIERIVINVTANPAIRFFLICGKDSPLFRPGQSLVALAERGVDDQRRIVGAAGYDPVLPTVAPERVARFRRQVEVLDWTGVEDLDAIERGVRALAARNPGHFASGEAMAAMAENEERFVPIRPGGTREPLQYDPKGYFVITVDREEEQISLRHYLPDHTPAHEMRGRVAGSMLLGLLREGLVSQLSHAGYLGEELAKAQAALTLGLRYDQDRPLRAPEAPAAAAAEAMPGPAAAPGAAPAAQAPAAMPPMGRIAPPMTLTQLRAATPGASVDVALAVDDLAAPDPAANGGLMGGALLEPDDAEPFSAFRRTQQRLRVRWTTATRIVMGEAADLHVGALVRARGTLGADGVVDTQGLVILTRVARIVEG
jgi:tetrahydromethanopterin S-methyltransferase subunit A